MCKWDIPVDPTIKLLDIMINNLPIYEWNLPRALVEAQKEMVNLIADPSAWAGLEYWLN